MVGIIQSKSFDNSSSFLPAKKGRSPTLLTISQADKLLVNWLWCGTDPESRIVERWYADECPILVTEVPRDDKLARNGRRRYTVSREERDHFKAWGKHLKGQAMCGPVKGDKTAFLKVDLDRHSDAVPGKQHAEKVISFLDKLRAYPALRIIPEIDPLNASAALWVFLPRPLPTDKAKQLAARLRQETGFAGEIYPDNCPKVYLPFRPDKLSIIDTGVCPTRILIAKDGWEHDVYDTRKIVAYLRRNSFPDVEAVKQALAEGILNLPDKVAPPTIVISQETPSARTRTAKKTSPGGGMGSVKYKGRFLKNIIDFKNGNIQPDTIGCFTTPIRRLLSIGYGLPHDDIDDIFQGIFDQHDVSYSDRLSTSHAIDEVIADPMYGVASKPNPKVSYDWGMDPCHGDADNPTPPHATQALVDRERFVGTILEPACGDGAIVRVLKKHGCDVEATDILDGQDFLARTDKAVNIITNPPYRNSLDFILHAKKVATRKIAMLLPVEFLHGSTRHELFQDRRFPLKVVYVFSSRLRFGSETDATVGHAWYVWDRKHKGEPSLRWIK
jgi:hypothetical protein